jgi:hypothetical protein
MKMKIEQQFTLWEEKSLYYMTVKGRFYQMDLITHRCHRISRNMYECYLEIYHS